MTGFVIVWLDEFAVVKILDRIKNLHDVQGLTLYLAQIIVDFLKESR